MKKYIKPMMESEAFVANEYVSACWLMDCECRGSNEMIAISGTTVADAMYGEFGQSIEVPGYNTSDDTYIMVGNLYGSSGESCTTAHAGLGTEQVGGIDCSRFSGLGYWVCVGLTWLFGDGSTTRGEAHHHVTLIPTNKSNYSQHPNHS